MQGPVSVPGSRSEPEPIYDYSALPTSAKTWNLAVASDLNPEVLLRLRHNEAVPAMSAIVLSCISSAPAHGRSSVHQQGC